MEVLIGFAVGYWLGTRQGRQGLQQAMDSAQAILTHPQTRKLLKQGMAAAEVIEPVLSRKPGGRSLAALRTAVEELAERRGSEAA